VTCDEEEKLAVSQLLEYPFYFYGCFKEKQQFTPSNEFGRLSYADWKQVYYFN